MALLFVRFVLSAVMFVVLVMLVMPISGTRAHQRDLEVFVMFNTFLFTSPKVCWEEVYIRDYLDGLRFYEGNAADEKYDEYFNQICGAVVDRRAAVTGRYPYGKIIINGEMANVTIIKVSINLDNELFEVWSYTIMRVMTKEEYKKHLAESGSKGI